MKKKNIVEDMEEIVDYSKTQPFIADNYEEILNGTITGYEPEVSEGDFSSEFEIVEDGEELIQ